MILLTLLVIILIIFILGLGLLAIISPFLLDLAAVILIVALIRFIVGLTKKKKGDEIDE